MESARNTRKPKGHVNTSEGWEWWERVAGVVPKVTQKWEWDFGGSGIQGGPKVVVGVGLWVIPCALDRILTTVCPGL
jgi:hypothetical protein